MNFHSVSFTLSKQLYFQQKDYAFDNVYPISIGEFTSTESITGSGLGISSEEPSKEFFRLYVKQNTKISPSQKMLVTKKRCTKTPMHLTDVHDGLTLHAIHKLPNACHVLT
jgi:hypothetical protein